MYDPLSEEFRRDPYPHYRQLREDAPVHLAPQSRLWCAIHQHDLARDVDDAVTLTGWISPDAASWVRAREHVTAKYLDKPQVMP